MPFFLYRIEPARAEMPADPTPEELELVGRHFAHLKAGFDEGFVQFVGRTSEPPFLGIAILSVPERASAEKFLRDDPAVAAGVFTGMIQAFSRVLPT